MSAPHRDDLAEALQRFGKRADLASIIPAVAAPAIGAYLGRRIGGGDLGALLGGVTGGVAGQYVREELPNWRHPSAIPAGAPYAIDPSAEDIPPWALSGAHLLRPMMKSASGDGWRDVVFGDTLGPLYPLGQAAFNKNHTWGGALKKVVGQGAGVLGGGLLGMGAGKLLSKAVGRDLNIPGVNLPLSDVLSGLGATVGGLKGLRHFNTP